MTTRRSAMRLLASGSVGLAAGGDPFLERQAPDPELLIRSGQVVNADGIRDADVRVVGERIAEIGAGLRPGAGARVIEADRSGARSAPPRGLRPSCNA